MHLRSQESSSESEREREREGEREREREGGREGGRERERVEMFWMENMNVYIPCTFRVQSVENVLLPITARLVTAIVTQSVTFVFIILSSIEPLSHTCIYM